MSDTKTSTVEDESYDDLENPGLQVLIDARNSKVGREYLRSIKSSRSKNKEASDATQL